MKHNDSNEPNDAKLEQYKKENEHHTQDKAIEHSAKDDQIDRKMKHKPRDNA